MSVPLSPALPMRRRTGLRTGGSLFVLAVTVAVGFVLVGQMRSTQRFSPPLQAESEEDLTRILASLNAEKDALEEELVTLRIQLESLRTSSQRDEVAVEAAEEQLRSLSVLAGTVAVTGPGLLVEVRDPEGRMTYDAMIDMVQELRDAGAEALAVNNQRVGVASAFAESDGRVLLDGQRLSSPYLVAAIGQASTLEGGLKIPGGVLDTLTALNGVLVELKRSARIDLPALSRTPSFRVARPVGS